MDNNKTPFPWFGGKSACAPEVWAALGDVDHYVEPFAGSLAVLLRRPHAANRTYHSETVNDLDGLLVNFWRSVQLSPEALCEAASWPVTEADLTARHLWLVRWRAERDLERLMGDPLYHDPRVAGWWVWGLCCWIGGGWCDGRGAWVADEQGRLVKRGKTTEEGVHKKRPHLGDDGMGINHAGLREEGVARQKPHLGDNGKGINRPQLREEGVFDLDGVAHPIVMPKLRVWIDHLCARLRHVRICNGPWERVCTTGALQSLTVRQGKGVAGVFLDPPYGAAAGREDGLYGVDSLTVAADVLRWCEANGANPRYRIVLAGYEGEGHEVLEAQGWRAVEWYKRGHLTGGYGNQSEEGHQQGRERLWLSPHCQLRASPQTDLFGGAI